MRLFIAIDFEELRDDFIKVQNKLIDIPNIKLRPVKSCHLTLKFLGNVQPDALDKTKHRLKNIKFSEFELSLSDAGFFPSKKSPRVIWAGIKPEEPVLELQKNIDDSLNGLFEKEKEFKPHITLARVEFVRDIRQFLDSIEKIRIEDRRIKINNFNLYKSTLTSKGAIHEVMERFNCQK